MSPATPDPVSGATAPQDASSAIPEPVLIVDHDPRWAARARAEIERLTWIGDGVLIDVEHIGSTAVPGLKAKPVLDLMAGVAALGDVDRLAPALAEAGYRPVPTDFQRRRFLRKRIDAQTAAHLHLIPRSAWPTQHERVFRDWLIAHPEAARAYGELKAALALRHGGDRAGYTEAKTAFIQGQVNAAREALGLPPQTDWTE